MWCISSFKIHLNNNSIQLEGLSKVKTEKMFCLTSCMKLAYAKMFLSEVFYMRTMFNIYRSHISVQDFQDIDQFT